MTYMKETDRQDSFHDSPIATDCHDGDLVCEQITCFHTWNDMMVEDCGIWW